MPSKAFIYKLSRKPKETIYIGLGSSVGNAEEFFKKTELFLEKNNIKVIKKSSVHKTAPWGGKAQNMFSNSVWELQMISTKFAQRPLKKAYQLLSVLQECETQQGRNRNQEVRWGDRCLDLDILWFESFICNTKKLTLPHPYMFKRDFVTEPLKEIL